MKKQYLFLTATVMLSTFISFVSCSKDDDATPPGETKELYVDATSSTIWQYYSFAEEKIVGAADDSEDNNAIWAARKDWDIAIRRYNVRTNSGLFTTVGAKGGVYTLDANIAFASVQKVPADAVFVGDKQVSYQGMGGTITTVQSTAQVILLKKDTDGSTIMPPVYLKTPVYIFRTADGESYYKLSFTQYVNEGGATGHVKFDMARIY